MEFLLNNEVLRFLRAKVNPKENLGTDYFSCSQNLKLRDETIFRS
jgi:hypothetical protein